MTDTTYVIEDLAPGRTVVADDGTWTAGAPADPTRWLHEAGERQVSDATVQRWVNSGKAQVQA